MARNFNELRQGRPKQRGICTRCEKNPTAGRFQLGIQSYSEKSRPGRVVASRSFSLCEECCVEVYETALGHVLADVADPGGR